MRNRCWWGLARVWGVVLLVIPPTFAGVVVTRSGQVQIGQVTVLPAAVTVESAFGKIRFGLDKITWHDPDPAIDSVLKAAQAAERAGKDAVALHLYQVSRDDEAATRSQALAGIKDIRDRQAPVKPVAAPVVAKTTATAPAAKPEGRSDNAILREVKNDLVALKAGKRLSRIDKEAMPDVDYYAVYFSAHWCPPCRAFTPKLVEFYDQARQDHAGKFEIIFVSSDNSEDEMTGYMTGAKMNWPAVKFSEAAKCGLRRYAGPGIPCLVLLDRQGKVVADSYVSGQYVGPYAVMEKLGALLDK